MGVFDQGGGGGRARPPATEEENGVPGVDLSWPLTPDGLEQITQQLNLLSKYALVDINTPRLLGRYSPGKGRVEQVTLNPDTLALSSSGELSAIIPAATPTTSIVLSGATVLWATGTITDAQMKTMTTPITLIPAVPAKMILLAGNFIGWLNASVYGGTAVNLTVRYNGTVQALLAAFTVLSTTGHRMVQAAGSFNIQTATDYRNRAVEVVGSANAGGTYTSESGFNYAIPYILIP